MKHSLILIIILFTASWLYAENDTICRRELVDYVNKMQAVGSPEGDQVYEIDYSVSTEYISQAQMPIERTNFKVLFSKDLFLLESEKVSVYADTIDAFMVSHDYKKINWNVGSKNDFAEISSSGIASQQLKLIQISNIRECKSENINNDLFHKMILELPKDESNKLHVGSIEVLYNVKEERIFKVQVNYKETAIKKQIHTYTKVNYQGSDKIKGTAKSRVLNSKSELIAKYKDYSLTINR